jgi:hypothetical protein
LIFEVSLLGAHAQFHAHIAIQESKINNRQSSIHEIRKIREIREIRGGLRPLYP